MDAKVTLMAVLKDMCEENDPADLEMTFRELVEWQIQEEGLCSFLDDFVIMDVQEVKRE